MKVKLLKRNERTNKKKTHLSIKMLLRLMLLTKSVELEDSNITSFSFKQLCAGKVYDWMAPII